ncbi:response regulator transcription factor [Streptomyces sp. NPDC048518]|uniref:response regulator transcription factor n=1 Tax=Streptomyces sp. NPDC048518 TaxID=3155029 RepID=UPI00340F29FA
MPDTGLHPDREASTVAATPLCQQCAAPLPPAAERGRPRNYCSSTCRSAARRQRQRAPREPEEALNTRCSTTLAGYVCGGEASFPLTVNGRTVRVCGTCYAAAPLILPGTPEPEDSRIRPRHPGPGSARTPDRVLLIEDDIGVRSALEVVLQRSGYQTSGQESGLLGLREIFDERPDLVLLDLGLPDINGIEVLRRLRAVSDIPVIILTARADINTRVIGLTTGADDYLAKPCATPELLARMDRVLHRHRSAKGLADQVYDDGLIYLDPLKCEVLVAGTPLHLTARECRLLHVLVRNGGTVQPMDTLLAAVGSGDARHDRTMVTLAMSRIRLKLHATALGSASIVSARGVGYLYRPPTTPPQTAARSESHASSGSYGHAAGVLNILDQRPGTPPPTRR